MSQPHHITAGKQHTAGGNGALRSAPGQHGMPFTRRNSSSSQTCVYAILVSGLACRADLCAKNKSLDAR
jgi:hypothetical protein